jgi:octaprenyl-diphosphate synthase
LRGFGFGTERAVLMGDYLYAAGFSVLAEVRDPAVMQHMADVCQQLSRGEFHEVDVRFNLDLGEAEYLEIIRDKTAALIGACCRLGAQVAGASADIVDRVTRYGWDLGMAFQIADDCLDLTGDEDTVGKSLLSDLDKGTLSLPLIYLAQGVSRSRRAELFAPVINRVIDRRFLGKIAREAQRSGAIERALQTARRFARSAVEAIHGGDVALAPAYEALADYAIRRVH